MPETALIVIDASVSLTVQSPVANAPETGARNVTSVAVWLSSLVVKSGVYVTCSSPRAYGRPASLRIDVGVTL